jgi:uncharacterized protein YkwD
VPTAPPIELGAVARVSPRTLATLLLQVLAVAAAMAPAAARAQVPAACPAATAPLGAAAPATVEAGVLCLVNAQRAAAGLASVQPAGALEVAAQRHARDMVARRYFAHESPSGGTVDRRARRAGYLTAPCWVLGEDLARAPSPAASAAAVVDAWMASPRHRAVILEPEFRDAGIGLVGHAPTGRVAGATFVLELGAITTCRGR